MMRHIGYGLYAASLIAVVLGSAGLLPASLLSAFGAFLAGLFAMVVLGLVVRAIIG